MYKIEFIPTGHVFLLPDDNAKELKNKYPNDYRIIEKNGKKFRDKFPEKREINTKSIRHLVVEVEN